VRTGVIEQVMRCGILGPVHAGTEGASTEAAGASRAAGVRLRAQAPVCERHEAAVVLGRHRVRAADGEARVSCACARAGTGEAKCICSRMDVKRAMCSACKAAETSFQRHLIGSG
jgi:hypothetical protein